MVKIGSLWIREHDNRRYWIVSRLTKINTNRINVTLLSMSKDLQITFPVDYLCKSFRCIGKCQ